MHRNHLFSVAAASAVLVAGGCNKQSAEVARHISELERKTAEAVARQQDLEQQLAEQKLAAEREAIERERMEIEDARADLQNQQGAAAAAADEQIRQREEALASREGGLQKIQAN